MRRRTPQEKKALSLERDGRNVYGENDKASRKNIRRAKARANRANRRADSAALAAAEGAPDEELNSVAQDRLEGRRRKVWRKVPDQALGKKLARRDGTETAGFDPSRLGPH